MDTYELGEDRGVHLHHHSERVELYEGAGVKWTWCGAPRNYINMCYPSVLHHPLPRPRPFRLP
jgi:hypothetical protein